VFIKYLVLLFKDSNIRLLTRIASSFEKRFSDLDNFTCLDTFLYGMNTIFVPDSRFVNVRQLSNSEYSIFTLPAPDNLDNYPSKQVTMKISSTREFRWFLYQTTAHPPLLACSELKIVHSLPTSFDHLMERNLDLSNLK
jgi:hypothetical protein